MISVARSGTTAGAAAAAIETAKRMEALPAMAEAFQPGQLSEVRAKARVGHPSRDRDP